MILSHVLLMLRNITYYTYLNEICSKHIAKHQKTLTRAISQTKIKQVRRSATYQFGYLIPRDYKHALELDKPNGNSRWYDATKNTKNELGQINEYKVFINHGRVKYHPKSKRIINAPQRYQQIKVHPVFGCKHDGHQWQVDTKLLTQLIASILEQFQQDL